MIAMDYSDLYALVDCNHFYVSCERAFNPKLEKKPVAVLSNNDGCIVALSPELKSLGITRGTPYFKVKHLIRKHDIKVFSSNYTLYADMSFRVMSVLNRFTPELEVYSIDEAFLRLSGFNSFNLNDYGNEIRNTVKKWTGIPVSIGIAPTKTLSKLANRVAKKSNDNQGLFFIDNASVHKELLQHSDVAHIWGIGSRYAAKLKRAGICNVLQLTEANDEWIVKNMTIVGLRMVNELRGIPYIENNANNVTSQREKDLHNTDKWSDLYLPNAGEPRKTIVSSRSFGKPVESYNELSEALSSYCLTALNKLRQQGSLARRITVFITTNPFKDEPQYANYREAALPTYSAYPPDFTHLAKKMLTVIYRKGYCYKKVGVMISDIIQEEKAPRDLFQTAYEDDYRSDVMNCVDSINGRWGQGTINFAGAGINKSWKMRRHLLSQRYTTSWKELPLIK